MLNAMGWEQLQKARARRPSSDKLRQLLVLHLVEDMLSWCHERPPVHTSLQFYGGLLHELHAEVSAVMALPAACVLLSRHPTGARGELAGACHVGLPASAPLRAAEGRCAAAGQGCGDGAGCRARRSADLAAAARRAGPAAAGAGCGRQVFDMLGTAVVVCLHTGISLLRVLIVSATATRFRVVSSSVAAVAAGPHSACAASPG